MSKTILQEIATFNAQEFNAAKVKTEISDYQMVVDDYFDTSKEIINDGISSYKIIAERIKQDNANKLDLTNVEITKNKLLVSTLEEFTIKEFASNYRTLGVIRREFRRKDVQLDNKIDQQTLKKLSFYTGPIASVLTDANGNFTGYGTPSVETTRAWMYIIDRALKYKGYPLLELNSVLDTITIGDTSHYNKVVLPGTLNLTGDLTISDGKITVTSPDNYTESITVNKTIHSTAGALIGTTGVSTTNGDITTGTGNIKTVTGNIETGAGYIKTVKGDIITNEGDIKTLKGGLFATTGVTTTSGDIVTNNGALVVTTGMSTTNGNISTGTGSLLITKGDIKTLEGAIRTDRGSITTGDGAISTTRGNISSDQGNITTLDGNIRTTRGNISTARGDIYSEDGKFWIGGTGSFWTQGVTKMLMDSGDLTISGKLKTYGALEVPSLVSLGEITGTNLTLSGVVTANGTGTSSFNGPVSTKALTTTSITATGAVNTKNLTVDGTLTVNGTSTFNGNVTAGAYTMTASQFIGVATSANYADVAEKYLCNEVLEPGTIVQLSNSDTHEIEKYSQGPLAGVISTAPGVMLNENETTIDEKWLYVALVGRVPIKVSNKVTKNMYIIADKDNAGYAKGIPNSELTWETQLLLIGVSLGNSENGIVEVKVK